MSKQDQISAEEHRAAVLREYSQFVAVEPIDHNGVRAYNPGDPVPAANVREYNYEERGLVRPRGEVGGA